MPDPPQACPASAGAAGVSPISRAADSAIPASRLDFITTTLHCARTRICGYGKDNNLVYTVCEVPGPTVPRATRPAGPLSPSGPGMLFTQK
jgi:hypothetical protein